MIFFSQLAPESRLLLSCVLFFAALIELAFFIYRFANTKKIRNCVKDILFFVIILILLSFFTAVSLPIEGQVHPVNVPWLIIPIITGLVLLRAAIGLSIERRLRRGKVSRRSIKNAFDCLPTGICFCDSKGNILLINKCMAKLLRSLTGSVPDSFAVIKNGLSSSGASDKVEWKDENTAICRPSDDEIWKISLIPLTDSDMSGFIQISAENITETYSLSLKLEEKDKELEKTNEELHIMYNKLIERIKYQEKDDEMLRARVNFESSLSDISNLVETGGNIDESITTLSDAVDLLRKA